MRRSSSEKDSNSGIFFFLYLVPIGLLLTQYTITGFDASAHISEETHGASRNAARGVWQSIFYSAIIGWIVLLAITFAVQDPANISNADNGFGAGSSLAIFSGALSSAAFKAVVLISSEFNEVLAVADKILVLRDGRVEASVPRSAIRSEAELHQLVQAG